MNDEIRKIDLIKNMAVFKDFDWASSVRDAGNNVAEFKKINIFYGRNYSGKTTLSRIFRAMETGSISDKFTSPEFQLSCEGATNITQNSLIGHEKVVRVFNEDFVKENLRFIVDDEHTINSFAILGDDNTKLEDEIKQSEIELGSEEGKLGLIGTMLEANKNSLSAKKSHDDRSSNLEKKLKEKANKSITGIKHNKAFGDANYNVTKIKADIKTISAKLYKQITSEQIDNFYDLLKEVPKKEISEFSSIDLKYSTFASTTKELIEKKIQASDPIQELLNDSVLETWVRNGRGLHKEKRTQCAFCGSDLPSELWEKLDKHFNKKSEELRTAIDHLISSIKTEKSRIPSLFKIKSSDFYYNFSSDIEKLSGQFDTQSTAYCETLEALKTQLKKRKNDIFTPKTFSEPNSEEKSLASIWDSLDKLRNKSNKFTTFLSDQQKEARAKLRLHEVFTFTNDINYGDEQQRIETLKEKMESVKQTKIDAKNMVNDKKTKISGLKSQLKDESKGADKVNDYLNNFFGHQSLSLKAIENANDGTQSGYRFEVTRNEQKAFHLSEGECSLIAFCYFMAKLVDIETKGSQPIIWIDDPISSLDANHIFFVYSLINAEIVTPEKYVENGEEKKRERFKQLFISTHDLDFLKYLKKLPGASNKKKSQYFIVNRADRISHINLMPRYLKDYVTEFNYLFNQIYQCASIDTVDDQNYTTFYNFGNNTRKFFEIYLFYKYPNQGMNEETLLRFFGDEKVPAVLTDRINNEYSHLAGVFERGSTPVEVPEMKTTACFILQKICEKDPDQYSALLQSIGIENENSEKL
ncbi:MAG: AAA family ATPase [Desulfobacteraceae bacterium]|nr:AAA family ATPase [Desulfobacteraceae bacterium]